MSGKRILITGATGKVGQAFLKRALNEPKLKDFSFRALLHNRTLEPHERLDSVRGSIKD